MQRLLALALGLLMPLLFAVSLAWACGPGGGGPAPTLTPASGPAGSTPMLTVSGFAAGPVEVRWDADAGPMLATATGPAFSTRVTIPNNAATGPHYLMVLARDSTGAIVAHSPAVFQVTAAPSLSLQPASGTAGSATTAAGASFGSGAVELHWDATDGALLKTLPGPAFSTVVTIPASSSVGQHTVFAVSRDSSGNQAGTASASFEVAAGDSGASAGSGAPAGGLLPGLQPGATAVVSSHADPGAPAIDAVALTRQNGIRTVSRKGEVSVFCGTFPEAMTGVCGASSTRPLAQGGTSRPGKKARSAVLRLPAKAFHAQPGHPVVLKFSLTKASMKMLAAAKKVPMSGSVNASTTGGRSTRASFGLTLRAPAARGH